MTRFPIMWTKEIENPVCRKDREQNEADRQRNKSGVGTL